MKQVYLDGIILRVIGDQGNDPDLREDFIRRVLRDQLKTVIPVCFFPVRSAKATVTDGLINIGEEYLSVIAVDESAKISNTKLLLYDNKFYLIENENYQDYIDDSGLLENRLVLGKYAFMEDVMTNDIRIYTDQAEVSVFFYSTYTDITGRTVVPEFAANYLTAYGSMRALEVLLNKGLKGKTPTAVAQTRYSSKEMQGKVTREFLSMQREINLLVDRVIIKPVNSDSNAAAF